MRSMCTSILAFTLVAGTAAAQTPGKADPPVKATAATDVLTAQIQEAMKKGMAALKPGVTVSDRMIALSDIGPYAVGVAFVTRPGGKAAGDRTLSHDKITEIYYVLRGSGTQVTGELMKGNHDNPAPGGVIGPGWSGTLPLDHPRSTKLGPGDIQIIPPGVGHGWSEIAEGGIDYLTFRVDPEHVTALSK